MYSTLDSIKLKREIETESCVFFSLVSFYPIEIGLINVDWMMRLNSTQKPYLLTTVLFSCDLRGLFSSDFCSFIFACFTSRYIFNISMSLSAISIEACTRVCHLGLAEITNNSIVRSALLIVWRCRRYNQTFIIAFCPNEFKDEENRT